MRFIAVCSVSLVALTGCAAAAPVATHAPEPKPTVTAAANPVTPAIYLKLMHQLPDFANAKDADLLVIARSTCFVMTQPDGWLVSVKTFTDDGYDARESGAAIEYAIAAYCPQLQSAVPVQ